MKDQVTLAYINMFGILGALEKLCEYDREASDLARPANPLSIGFSVSGGPSSTLLFADGKCTQKEGVESCTIRLSFSDCEKFNRMIDGKYTPIPRSGFTHISFLTKNFTKMTDILGSYLRASEQKLKDPAFFEASTRLMFYLISGAVAQIGNHDKIGMFSASNMEDGDVILSIKDDVKSTITCKNHHLSLKRAASPSPRAVMEFQTIPLARALFDGKVNSMACIGRKEITVSGFISMLDNVNRILDRVAFYLA